FFFKQKPAYELFTCLEFRRVLFRSRLALPPTSTSPKSCSRGVTSIAQAGPQTTPRHWRGSPLPLARLPPPSTLPVPCASMPRPAFATARFERISIRAPSAAAAPARGPAPPAPTPPS